MRKEQQQSIARRGKEVETSTPTMIQAAKAEHGAPN